MRAVLDTNVLISAFLSPRGTPAQLVRVWRDGAFELVVSLALLAEIDRVLGYPKIARRIGASDAIAIRDYSGVRHPFRILRQHPR